MDLNYKLKKNDLIKKHLINHSVAVALLSGLALSGAGLQAQAADATFSGVLLVSRDITKPQVAVNAVPAAAVDNVSACKNTTSALKKWI
jgi:hypothetical protein